MSRKLQSNQSQSGFTLIEMLVLIVIIGVLFAIAAPSWLAFLSRQRVTTVRDDALQAIRIAQSEARKTRSPRVVQFNYASGSANDPARVVVGPAGTVTPPVTCPPPVAGLQSRVLGSDGIQRGQVRLAIYGGPGFNTQLNTIVFDDRGNVQCVRNATGGTSFSANDFGSGFMVTAYNIRPGTTNTVALRQCAIVSTILGGTYTTDGNTCRVP
jgi:prepilin-type N-terminal cleavage/methylation domain-containing protein